MSRQEGKRPFLGRTVSSPRENRLVCLCVREKKERREREKERERERERFMRKNVRHEIRPSLNQRFIQLFTRKKFAATQKSIP